MSQPQSICQLTGAPGTPRPSRDFLVHFETKTLDGKILKQPLCIAISVRLQGYSSDSVAILSNAVYAELVNRVLAQLPKEP